MERRKFFKTLGAGLAGLALLKPKLSESNELSLTEMKVAREQLLDAMINIPEEITVGKSTNCIQYMPDCEVNVFTKLGRKVITAYEGSWESGESLFDYKDCGTIWNEPVHQIIIPNIKLTNYISHFTGTSLEDHLCEEFSIEANYKDIIIKINAVLRDVYYNFSTNSEVIRRATFEIV